MGSRAGGDPRAARRPVARLGGPGARRGRTAARLGGPKARLGRPAARRGRPVARLGGPTARLGGPKAGLGRTAAGLGGLKARLGRPAALRGRPAARLGRPAALRGRPAAQLGRPKAVASPAGRAHGHVAHRMAQNRADVPRAAHRPGLAGSVPRRHAHRATDRGQRGRRRHRAVALCAPARLRSFRTRDSGPAGRTSVLCSRASRGTFLSRPSSRQAPIPGQPFSGYTGTARWFSSGTGRCPT